MRSNSPLYLCPDKIVCLHKHLDDNTGGIGTKVNVLGQDHTLEVKETPEQVMNLVCKALNAKNGS
ncbi:hypothetical protein ACFL30_03400 [Candidatus Latescibacterota bacterium]